MFHEQRHIILGKILRDRSVLVQKGNRHLSENYFVWNVFAILTKTEFTLIEEEGLRLSEHSTDLTATLQLRNLNRGIYDTLPLWHSLALKGNWCSKALSAGYIWEFWALIVNDICPSLATNHWSILICYTFCLMIFDLDLMNNKILEFVFKATIFFLIRSGRKFHDEWACLTQLLFSSCL